MRLVLSILVNALALWLTSLLLPGVHLGDDGAEVSSQILTVLAVGLVFALVNAIVKPILEFLAIPVTCLTLGLFQLVINAAMVALTSWLAGLVGLTFTLDSFWWALGAGIVVGILNTVLESLVGLGDDRREQRRERDYGRG